jgi:capsular exopolysaccharide synthesis family protein
MSRFADALKRARGGSVAGAGPEDDRGGDAVRFFSPGQPAVVLPWDLGRDGDGATAIDVPRHVRADRRCARLLEREHHSEARARFPSPKSSEKLITSPSVTPIVREQYNKLAAAIHQTQLERSLKVVMVTSAVPHEGKTLTAANLALTLSESYERRVLLIDGDLRHPTVHAVFGVPNARGLSDSLAGQGPLPLIDVTPRLWLLTAGSSGGDPMKTLTSDRMRVLIDDGRAEFDWVLVDTPPIGLLPDAGLVASVADGALFVVLAGRTPYDLIQRAAEAIGTDRILGVVLNGMAEHEVPAGYYGDYYGAANQ